jgi:hypothetical protein
LFVELQPWVVVVCFSPSFLWTRQDLKICFATA